MPMNNKIVRYVRLFGLAGLVIILDQFSKEYFINLLMQNNFFTIHITSFFNLVMVWNEGVSFGLFSAANARIYLIIMAFFVVSVLLFWYRKHQSVKLLNYSLGLIIGGAIGNVIDRLQYGAVADFFDFHLYDIHWPAFNVADMSIVCGVALLSWYELKKKN
jgi:signal peptidase II